MKKRLLKKALIELQADDMRKPKEDSPEDKKELNLEKEDKEPVLETKPVEEKQEKIDLQQNELKKPVTPEDVNNEFGVENPGMGFDMVSLEEGLLNDISSLYMLHQQVKFFHWIMNGENYIATHRFLDEVADGVLQAIDLLAERLVYLGTKPVISLFRAYIQFEEMNDPFKFYRVIDVLDSQFSSIIDKLKNNTRKANQKNDIGTEKLLQDIIYDLETFQHHLRSFK